MQHPENFDSFFKRPVEDNIVTHREAPQTTREFFSSATNAWHFTQTQTGIIDFSQKAIRRFWIVTSDVVPDSVEIGLGRVSNAKFFHASPAVRRLIFCVLPF